MLIYDDFINIHTHTHYSNSTMFDSTTKVADLVKRVAELGQPAVSITDHGTVSGLMDGYNQVEKFNKRMAKEGKEQRLKFIFGSEFYFVDDVNVKERKNYHLVLIAKDMEGYKNLLKLTTLAHRNTYYKPRIDWSMLQFYSKGLIATSACIGGILNIKSELPFPTYGHDGDGEESLNGFQMKTVWDKELSVQRLERFLELFGKDFFMEIHTNTQTEQKEYNLQMVKLAEEYNLAMIACVDSHYVYASQANIHRAFVGVQENDESGYYKTDDYFIMYSQEVRDRLNYLPETVVCRAIANTVVLASRCDVQINKSEKNYPTFPVENQLERLKELCRDGWKRKIIPHVPREKWKEYGDRVNEELEVLIECDYINYFLITHDMLDWCSNRAEPPVFTGIGRGSVGGSMVAYLMDITKIDPIKTDLLFSRFAHTARISPPDIDSDIENSRRPEVIEYIHQKYNGDVYHVRTFSYMQAKGALKRAGQALKMSHGEVNVISKGIKPDSDKYQDQLKALDEIRDKKNGKLIDLAKDFVGIIQGYSTHASAIIVFPKDPNNWCAIERQLDSRTKEERFIASYDFHDLEDQGLLKLDILGLKTLDVMHNTLCLIGSQEASKFDIEHLPEDDELTFKMLQNGSTQGCFQIESQGMTSLVKSMQPNHYLDMIPLVALYRPGCLKAGMVEVFVKRRLGEESVEYIHPLMKETLKDTYGVILYQEQIQKLANVLAGYDMGEADLLRRAVGKKMPEEMVKIKPDFISRMVKHLTVSNTLEEHDYLQATADRVWELIEYFGGYGFNKSHSASYGYESFQTAYLKAHYPVQYMVSLLNAYNDAAQEELLPYVEECRKMGIEILPPDANKSETSWIVELHEGKQAIRVGLSYLKGVGKIEFEKPIASIADIKKSKVQKNKIEALIKAGALDFTGFTRSELLVEVSGVRGDLVSLKNKITEAYQKIDEKTVEVAKTKDTTKKHATLLQQIANLHKDIQKSNKKISELEGLQNLFVGYNDTLGEREVLGFSFSDILLQYDLSWAVKPCLESKKEHIIGGEVIKFKGILDKNKKPMAFITLRTSNETVELVMFHKKYMILEEGKVYLLSIQENRVTDTKVAELKKVG